MRTVLIVQARMSSTRLPGKVLKPVLAKPLLAYQLERLRRAASVTGIVVATTTGGADDAIERACETWGVPCFRGSENDVLARYHQAAEQHGAQAVVRATADCPLIDPSVVDRIVGHYLSQAGRCDYASNTLRRSFPRGLDVEVFSAQALREAHEEAREEFEREHVTPFIYRRPERYRLMEVVCQDDQSSHRWTVDTPEDFELVRRIIEALYLRNPEFSMQDVLDLLKEHPDWPMINAGVEQKKLGE